MSIEELSEASAIEFGINKLAEVGDFRLHDPKDILRLGRSLVVVSGRGFVKLARLSVKDYQLSENIKQASSVCEFSISPGGAFKELALSCLTYPSLDSLTSDPTMELDKWEARVKCHPLLKHATKAWPYYSRAMVQCQIKRTCLSILQV